CMFLIIRVTAEILYAFIAVCLILKADCYYIIIVIIYRHLMPNTKLIGSSSKSQECDLIDSISSGHTGLLSFIEIYNPSSTKADIKVISCIRMRLPIQLCISNH